MPIFTKKILALKLRHQIIFWIASSVFLTLFYGYRNDSMIVTSWFVGALLPISMLTTYIFTVLLVPRYLLQDRIAKFFLYSLYTMVISAYLEYILLILIFIFLADLHIETANFDSVFLLIGMYVPVLLGIVIFLFQNLKKETQQKALLHDKNEQLKQSIDIKDEIISVRADRVNYNLKPTDIVYLEGLKDYVKIHRIGEKPLIVKSTLSKMGKLLEKYGFVRIHKSYIVSVSKVSSYTNSEVEVMGVKIPIGPMYKEEFIQEALK